jgi:hypothetical protein
MKRTLLLAGLSAVLIPASAQSQTREVTFPLGFNVDFGQIHVLSSGTQLDKMNVVVRNSGTAPVTITSAALTGAPEFVLSTKPLEVSGPVPFPVVLQPGQVTALVHVHFFPTQAGVRTASLAVTSDATGSPHAVSLRAEAVDTPLGPWPWTFVGPPLGQRLVNAIVVDPDDDNVWYVPSMSGLYITRNGGASWELSLAPSGINGSIMGGEALAIDPTDTRRVYAAIGSNRYGSTDKGRSWAVVHTLPLAGSGAITVGDNGTVYATTPGVSGENPGILISEDFGASWNFHAFGVAISFLIPWDIARDPVNGTLYVVTEPSAHPQPYNPPLLRSLDNGVTWQDVSGSLPWHGVQVQVDPFSQDVYVLQEGPGLYRSSNFGLSWEFLSNAFYLEFLLDESHRNRQYGGAHYLRGGGAFLSTDAGYTFNRIGLSNLNVASLATNRTGTKLYAAVYGAGIFVTSVAVGRDDLVIDFGAAFGVWLQQGPTWSQLHSVSSESMVTGDLDGNAVDDLVVDFGPTFGLWVWMNHTTWLQLHVSSPSLMATGDLDHNLRDEVILDFPGHGLWVWSNNAAWMLLHPFQAGHLAVGNLDGTAGDEVIVDFPGHGIWVYGSSGAWSQLHASSATTIVTADLDGNGLDESVIDFPGFGLWVYWNNTAWTQLHALSATHIAAGNLDGSAQEDLVIDFGSAWGLWTLRNGATWAPLHPLSSEGFVLLDRDEGSGRDEVVVDFGAAGVWQYWNDSIWTQIHWRNPEDLTAGRYH